MALPTIDKPASIMVLTYYNSSSSRMHPKVQKKKSKGLIAIFALFIN